MSYETHAPRKRTPDEPGDPPGWKPTRVAAAALAACLGACALVRWGLTERDLALVAFQALPFAVIAAACARRIRRLA